MWLVVPFLLLVVILPALAFVDSRKRSATPGEWPSPTALYVQIIVVQSVLAGLACMAMVGAGVKIAWSSRLGLDTTSIAIGLVVLMFLVSMWLMRRQGSEPSVGQAISPRRRTEWMLWFPSLAVAAIAEEFAYRGVLFALSARIIDAWIVSAIVVSMLFGLAHKSQGWVGVWGSAAFGFGMQVLAERSGGLALPIAAHFAYDAGIEFLSRRNAARQATVAGGSLESK